MSLDFLSYPMLLLCLVLFSVVSLVSSSQYLSLITLILVGVFFITDSPIFFFIFFEASLIPIIVMIMGWGVQSERLGATKFFFMYTIVSSSPLFVYLLILEDGHQSFKLALLDSEGMGAVWMAMVAFFVKIPLMWFHSWLPKAHVEAPLEGSMILAGIMLKVGFYGLIRVQMISLFSRVVNEVVFCISGIGCVTLCLLSLSADDMKMSVAYSSITHMNFATAVFMSLKELSLSSSVMTMMSHGLGSPLLFFLVTKIYSMSNSRSVLINKGLASKFPLMVYISFLLWSLNLSAPPSLAFLGEVSGALSMVAFFVPSALIFILFFMLNSFFSAYNFAISSHSSNKLKVKFVIKDFKFLLTCHVFIFELVALMFFVIIITI